MRHKWNKGKYGKSGPTKVTKESHNGKALPVEEIGKRKTGEQQFDIVQQSEMQGH